MKLKDTSFSVRAERAILFRALSYPNTIDLDEEPLEELSRLAKTAGANVIYTVIQKRAHIDPLYYIGKGKAQELQKIAVEMDADVLIFDHNLSPSPIKNF